MRLRILELPSHVHGEVVDTPFVYVLDDCGPELTADLAQDFKDRLKTVGGAAGTLVFPARIELGDE